MKQLGTLLCTSEEPQDVRQAGSAVGERGVRAGIKCKKEDNNPGSVQCVQSRLGDKAIEFCIGNL